MYQVGDRVVYGIHGVCNVTDWEERMVDRKQVRYLVLEPVGQEGARFLVPTHNAAAMAKLRSMLSPEEMKKLLASEQIRAGTWIREENQRKQVYRELINSGDRAALMQMVHALYDHKSTQLAEGKKIHQCDENFLRDAEKLLAGEIAIVLDLEPDQARNYVREQLK